MALKTNLNEKRKEKKEETLPVARWPGGRPSRTEPVCPFFPRADGPSEPSRAFLFFTASAWAGPGATAARAPLSLESLTCGPRLSAASSIPTRDRAGVEHGVLRSNPEFYGILLQVKVSWGYLSKPHAFAHLFYKDFGIVCPSSRPQAR
jgi:hypothetical protein